MKGYAEDPTPEKQLKKQELKLKTGSKPPSLPEDTSQLALVAAKKPWSHKDLENKLALVFYVAPSEKELNRHVTDAIKAAKISRDHYSSFAIVNMAASGWPNFLIAIKLKQSQKEFTHTTYVKDYKKVLVKEWGLKDESNDVLLFDTSGELLFRYDGKLPKDKVVELVDILKKKTLAAQKAMDNLKKEPTNKKDTTKK